MTADADALRVACLGAGYFARFHYDAWRQLPRVRLVGACDRDIEKAKATGLPSFDGLETMLKMARPNLLDIITPPPTHLAAIKLAIENGIDAIVCQKPFCNSLDEAKEAVRLAGAAGISAYRPRKFQVPTVVQNHKAGTRRQSDRRPAAVDFPACAPGDGQGREAYLDQAALFPGRCRGFSFTKQASTGSTRSVSCWASPRPSIADLRKLNSVIAGEDAGYFVFDYAERCTGAVRWKSPCWTTAAENCRTTLGEASGGGNARDVDARPVTAP